MRICLISAFDGNLDEGMKNVAYNLGQQLSQHHQVSYLNVGCIRSRGFWQSLRKANPQIIHYTHGPSLVSLALMKCARFYCRNAQTVISATQPRITGLGRRFASLLQPDLILTQSTETDRLFERLRCRTCFVPNGVDTERFVPVTKDAKQALRRKYGVDQQKFVILHVGTIGEKRNLSVLGKMQTEGEHQVIIVGSLAHRADPGIAQRMEEAGCLVWRSYFPHVEELYALSDCYIFPVRHRLGSVELPLSVMEAMSCNLPVISTHFGGLPDVFREGHGLYLAEEEGEFSIILSQLKTANQEVRTREQALPYSWRNIASKVEQLYEALVAP